MAELSRLGLSSDSWDVGRDEVQSWARENAGRLIKTIDATVVDKHVRPWLEKRLPELGWSGDGTGIPTGSLELAQELTDKFEAYPRWMAERVTRTEARMGLNAAAADIWERVGVTEVELVDGLGGKTGQTDAECLARNGQVVSIDEFRMLDREEHPNGSLQAIPVTADVDLQDLDYGLVEPGYAVSLSIYAVTDEGLILSQDEVGELLSEG